MHKWILAILSSILLASCATIVNDPNTPVALSFSDGSEGTCNLTNNTFNKHATNIQHSCKSHKQTSTTHVKII